MSSTRIAFAMCGSYCTFASVIPQMQLLKDKGYDITPIMSQNASTTDTRFGMAKDFIKQVEDISEKKLINTIKGAEPLGPKNVCDIILLKNTKKPVLSIF